MKEMPAEGQQASQNLSSIQIWTPAQLGVKWSYVECILYKTWNILFYHISNLYWQWICTKLLVSCHVPLGDKKKPTITRNPRKTSPNSRKTKVQHNYVVIGLTPLPLCTSPQALQVGSGLDSWSVEFSKLLRWEISQSHFSFLLPNGADAGLCQCGCRVAWPFIMHNAYIPHVVIFFVDIITYLSYLYVCFCIHIWGQSWLLTSLFPGLCRLQRLQSMGIWMFDYFHPWTSLFPFSLQQPWSLTRMSPCAWGKVRNPIPWVYVGFYTMYYKDIGEFQILYS